MSNPLLILQTLDKHLKTSSDLTLFGRAALALGFSDSPASFHNTLDVDAILPLEWVKSFVQQEDFWNAVQETNRQLEPQGLYLTHIFREFDIILRPSWINERVQIPLELNKLTVYRPSVIDLILTKMARGDELDLQDINFLLRQQPITKNDLELAFRQARLPEMPEIVDIFNGSKAKVLALATF